MENNKIQEIYNRLTTDQAFAEELKKFIADKKFASLEDEAAAFVEFAKSQGYDITLEDLKAFAKTQCKALNEEELDSVNAAGGGLCIGLGVGWGEASGFGDTMCYVVGEGAGVSWKDSDWYEAAMRGSKKEGNK